MNEHDLMELAIAFVTGLLSGFLVSIPVGPINLTIVNEGAKRGFLWAFLIGLGAVTMEVIYCSISFAGIATLFDQKLFKAALELMSFVLVVVLGWKYLNASAIDENPKTAQRIEATLHPRNAFTTGFVRVLGNPAVLLLWMTLGATFMAHEWVDPNWLSKVTCVAGIAIGASLWFLILSYTVSIAKSRFSAHSLLKLERFSGAALLIVACFIGMRIVLLLARHPHHRI